MQVNGFLYAVSAMSLSATLRTKSRRVPVTALLPAAGAALLPAAGGALPAAGCECLGDLLRQSGCEGGAPVPRGGRTRPADEDHPPLCVYVSLLAAAARGGKIHSGDVDPYLTLVGYFTTILLAGFAVDHAADVLRPLHDPLQWSVSCRLFADAEVAAEFLREHWPFATPFLELYGFMPEEGVFASLHAKCIVVDGRWVFAMSANFTDRGQTRNVEMGVLLEDARLAAVLEAQFVAREWVTRVS